jgi:ketosteroid isomerase-like protein
MAGAGSDRPAMSPDFEVVRRWFDAFNRRDLAETLALAHPEIRFSPLQVHGSGEWRGRKDIEAVWARMREVGLDHRVEITGLHDLPGGEVAALGLVRPGDIEFVGILRVEGGLVREARHRFADEDSLRRLGLDDAAG